MTFGAFFGPTTSATTEAPLRSAPCLKALPLETKEDFGKSGVGAGLDVELLDFDHVTLGDAVLFAAGFDNCVGHKISGAWHRKKDGETDTARPWRQG